MKTSVQDVRDACNVMLNHIKHRREANTVTKLFFSNMPGNKIEQIKIIRAATNMGLAETKHLVDSLDPRCEGGLIGPIVFNDSLYVARSNIDRYRRSYPSSIWLRYQSSFVITL